MVGFRCVGNCLEDIDNDVELSEETVWSDPSIWPDEKLPAEGENVQIVNGMNVVFDLEESPIF